MRSPTRRVLLALVSLGLMLAVAVVPASAQGRPGPGEPGFNVRADAMGSDPLRAGAIYRGDFPDPMVVRVGSTYYAYSTTIANKNLPVLTSSNLVTWRALGARRGGADPDALPYAARWSNWTTIDGRRVAPTWAPSVAKMGNHWVEAYATQRRDKTRFCISTSYSDRPSGIFVDSSTRPLVCPSTEGAIDPYLWRGDDDRNWLLFKTEGNAARDVPPRLWIQRLNWNGTAFVAGSHRRLLLIVDPDSWEGHVIENPAMIRYRGTYYLFYSGNSWATSRYAVGYATCRTRFGPCERPDPATPLIKSVGNIAGPGGASPFVDTYGRLRLAYHAWTKGQVGYPATAACRRTANGCPQRRMKIARVVVRSDGGLRVDQLSAG